MVKFQEIILTGFGAAPTREAGSSSPHKRARAWGLGSASAEPCDETVPQRVLLKRRLSCAPISASATADMGVRYQLCKATFFMTCGYG
jgi:hypothetical protein